MSLLQKYSTKKKTKESLQSLLLTFLLVVFCLLCSCSPADDVTPTPFDAAEFYRPNIVEIVSSGNFGELNTGTGVIIAGEESPIIATNLHVSGKYGEYIAVRFYGEENFINEDTFYNDNVIEVLCYDEDLDLCIFKVDYKPLNIYNILDKKIANTDIVPFCEDNAATIGTAVISYGNAGGGGIIKLEGKIVSPLEIVDTEFGDLSLIQTTLATTIGCSGGAMFDRQGRLLGLTSIAGGGIWGETNFSTPAQKVYQLYKSKILEIG